MGKLFQGGKTYKEIRHKLTMEHGVICNGDMIILSETLRKLVIKSVHDDIYDEYIKIKKFYTDYFTFMAQRSGAMESCAYRSCIHYWSGTLINTSRLFFSSWPEVTRVPDEKKFYDKTDSKGHIFVGNGITKNPGVRQCTRIL